MNLGKVFGAYDIRGLAGTELDELFTTRLASAYSRYLSPDKKGVFIVGCDKRPSSLVLAGIFARTLRELGHDVVDIGQVTTPLLYWYATQRDANGSVMVTASHLPGEYTGFKLCRQNAISLSSSDGLKEIQASMTAPGRPCAAAGRLIIEAPVRPYVAALMKHMRVSRPLKVAVDATMSAIGSELELMSQMNPDIQFQLVPEDGEAEVFNPLEDSALDALSNLVRTSGCEFGVAFDGDADRAVFVNEKGSMVPPDQIAGLIGCALLQRCPGGTVLYDLRANKAVPEMIEQRGGRAVRCRVGHSYIKAAMRSENAIFAGELSAHYYYGDLNHTDNALRTLIEVANAVSAGRSLLSELAEPYGRYATSGEINQPISDRHAVLAAIESAFPDADKDYMDGISIDLGDWWFNARGSNTEPLLRLNVGCKDASELERRVEQLLALIAAASNRPVAVSKESS